jgi:hypothetical protein
MSVDVAIAVMDREVFERSDYFLKWMMREWIEEGLTVAVRDDPAALPSARVAFAHFDVTVVDRRVAEPLDAWPVVINGAHTDISKRRISGHIVHPGDGYGGPVIVKTDLNYGGRPEENLAARASALRWAVDGVRRRLPWPWTGMMNPARYRVYPAPAAVPRPVWRNRHLVVEKFQPERVGGLHALRHHYFFGDCHADYALFSHNPVVKTSNVVAHRAIEEPPAEILAVRRTLGMDYGRLDYVIGEEGIVLFDANRTPAYTLEGIGFPYRTVGHQLADGIHAFLTRAERQSSAERIPALRAVAGP